MPFNTFINRFFGRDETETSKNMAKERLRLVLVHDRLDVSEQIMNALREDLLNVIGKYFGIDEKTLEVSLSREADGMALVANIPIRRQNPYAMAIAEAQVISGGNASKPAIVAAKPAGPPLQQIIPDQTKLFAAGETETSPHKEAAAVAVAETAVSKQSTGHQGEGKKNTNPKQKQAKKPEKDTGIEAFIE